MRDLFNEIWSTLRQNKLRTCLTGFAVSWGLFMIIALLGAGNGLLNALRGNSGDVMSNSMVVFPGSRSKAYGGMSQWSQIRFRDGDVDFTGSGRFGDVVEKAGGEFFYSDTLFYSRESVPANINGVYPIKKDIENLKVVSGRFINEKDMDENRKVIVLPYDIAEQLFGEGVEPSGIPGRYVRVSDIPFLVVGVLSSDETGWSYPQVPFNTVRKMRSMGDHVDRISFTFKGLNTEKDNEEFEKQYTRAMNRRHTADPDDENTIYIWNRLMQNMQMDKGTAILEIALWILGIFSLVSGIVGVSNIMLITVRERIHEFGIRKALGATPLSILKLIVAESIVITGFFGYIGMLFGLAANLVMDSTIGSTPTDIGFTQIYMFKNTVIGMDIAIEAMVLMVVAGTLAGIFPAMKAAKVRPIEALRSE